METGFYGFPGGAVPPGASGASGGGGLPLIAETVVTGVVAASITFSAIPGTYRHLLLISKVRDNSANAVDGFQVSFNGDTTAGHYSWAGVGEVNGTLGGNTSVGGAVINIGDVPGGTQAASNFGIARTLFLYYADIDNAKLCSSEHTRFDSVSSAIINGVRGGVWFVTSAITSLLLTPSAGSFSVGSKISLYGVS